MSNSPTATAAWWGTPVGYRYRLINLCIKLCIQLLNAFTIFLYRYKEISP